MFDDILVPIDGSDGSDRAVARAIELATQSSARIHVLTVVETERLAVGPDAGAVYDEFVGSIQDSGQRVVDDVVERVTAAGVDCADGLVRIGVPHQQIVKYVDEAGIDCIVMGTHGRSGVTRYLLGSVTENVVRTASIPVLTVPRAPDEE